MKPKTSL